MEYKLPDRIQESNKATFGKVLNIAGSDYMTGAAYLSSVSALKAGCGYCFLCSKERVICAVASQSQNIVFLPLKKLEDNIKSADVVEIGCGLSTDRTAENIFLKTINSINPETPFIIDADGLNILAKTKFTKIFLEKNFKNVILTPHPKEAARLLGADINNVLSDIKESAMQISKKYNSVTVLKTHKTIVTAPNGRTYTNTTGNSALAKAGSGDVLAGIISGLIAQGMNNFEGASLGVYLHGLCGELASKDLTQYSVMGKDLINYIPQAIKTII